MHMANSSCSEKSADEDIFKPLRDRGITCEEIPIVVAGRPVRTILASPAGGRLHGDPALLLVIGRADYHLVPPHDQMSRYFLDHGHRVVCMSVPRIETSLDIFRDAVMAGPDPVETTIREAQAVIEHCIDKKWARPGRFVVAGVSRNGYLALRLMAADARFGYGGGFAPVTDWRDLSEFAAVRNQSHIADLRIAREAERLAGRTIYLSIGHADQRVNTLSCIRFYLDLCEANRGRGIDPACVTFFVTPDQDHTCGDEWYARGMEILLKAALGGEQQP